MVHPCNKTEEVQTIRSVTFTEGDLSVGEVVTSVSIVKPTTCTNVSNLFYFGMTRYMFRTIFASIIRGSRLYIQQQAFVKQILLSVCFGMTLYMFRTVFPSIIRSSRLYIQQQAFVKQILLSACRQQYLFDKCLLLYVQS